MIRTLFCSTLVLGTAGILSAGNQVFPKAYVYVERTFSGSIQNTKTYNYSGQTVRMDRLGGGSSPISYTVTFPGLAPYLKGTPQAQITPVGGAEGHRYCSSNFSTAGSYPDAKLIVFCKLNGVSADVPFTAFILDNDADAAYATVNHDGTVASEIHNPWGSGVRLERRATGRTRVYFRLFHPAPTNGTVIAGVTTAVSSGHCQLFSVGSASQAPNEFGVEVDCYDEKGVFRATPFRIFAMREAQKAGFLLKMDHQVPWPGYSYNFAGGTIDVFRHAVGYYSVRFNGLAPYWFDEGTIKVTSHGLGGNSCSIGTFLKSQGYVTSSVKCHTPSGVAADGRFALIALTKY